MNINKIATSRGYQSNTNIKPEIVIFKIKYQTGISKHEVFTVN